MGLAVPQDDLPDERYPAQGAGVAVPADDLPDAPVSAPLSTALGPPINEPGRRVGAPRQFPVGVPQMPMVPGPIQALIDIGNTPPSPAWGDVLAQTPAQFMGSARQTLAGMQALDIVESSRLKAPPEDPAARAEWMSQLENAQSVGDTSFLYGDELNMTPDRMTRLQAELADARAAAAELEAAALPDRNLLQRGVGGVATSAPPSLAALGAGMVTGDPLIAAGTMFPMTAGQEFPGLVEQLQQQRMQQPEYGAMSPEQREAQFVGDLPRAATHAKIRGASGAITELLPMSKLLKSDAGIAERFLGDLFFDIPGESIDTMVGAIDQAIVDKPEGTATFEDVKRGAMEGLKQLPETAVTTTMMGGAQAGVAHSPQAIKNAIIRRAEDAAIAEVAANKPKSAIFGGAPESPASVAPPQVTAPEAPAAPSGAPPAAPVTMPAPPVSGSPPPDQTSPKASAPIGERDQGAALHPAPPSVPEQLTTATPPAPQVAAEPAAPSVPSAPKVPEPAPVAQQPVSPTAQKPPTGGAAPTTSETARAVAGLIDDAHERGWTDEAERLQERYTQLTGKRYDSTVAADRADAADGWVNKLTSGELSPEDLGRELDAKLAEGSPQSGPGEFFPESTRQHLGNSKTSLEEVRASYAHYTTLAQQVPIAQQDMEFRAAIAKGAREIESATNAYELQQATAGLAYNLRGATRKLAQLAAKGKPQKAQGKKAKPPVSQPSPLVTEQPVTPDAAKVAAAAREIETTQKHIKSATESLNRAKDETRRETFQRIINDQTARLEKFREQYKQLTGKDHAAPAKTQVAEAAPERLELPNRKKDWKGVPDAEIEVRPAEGGFQVRYSHQTPTEGSATPINHSPVFETREEAIQHAATELRKHVQPVPEGASVQKGEQNSRKRIRDWLDKVAPAEAAAEAPAGAADSPEFKKWFGKSKMVDDNGAPLVFYHGTSMDFAAFDRKAGRYTTHAESFNRLGSFFSNNPEHANTYAGAYEGKRGEPTPGGNVLPVYLSIQNPLYLDSRQQLIDAWKKHAGGNESLKGGDPEAFLAWMKSEGYDGIVMDAEDVDPGMLGPDKKDTGLYVIVPEANQIKSAVGNRGTFSKRSPNILKDQPIGEALADTAKGTTKPTEPEEPADRSTAPTDPLRAAAAKRAASLRATQARDKTPPVAPKRDQELGRSNFDSMWRDLFAPTDGSTVTPESAARREELIRRTQNAPLPQQMRLAKRRMKHYYDFKDIVIDPKLSAREALDVMLDAYNNLHTMANVMGQPRQAMGFNGKLTMSLKHSLGSKGTRGMFSWEFAKGFEASVLAVARRADSFTHEWIHAFDLGLLMRYFKSRDFGVSELSNYTRNALAPLPPRIRDAFTNVMRHLFVEAGSVDKLGKTALQAEQTKQQLEEAAAKLKRMEQVVRAAPERAERAAEHEKRADTEKDKFRAAGAASAAARMRETTATAQKELETQRAAVKALKDKLTALNKEFAELMGTKATAFHQGSAYVDKLTGNQYFSLPAEMLARAGEAWMANRIGQQVGVEFLAGSPEFYNDNADRLMALVYPNATDREAINQSFDELFAAVAEEQYFTGDTVASRIPADTAFSKELYAASKSDPKANVFRRFYQGAKHDLINLAISVKNIFSKNTAAKAMDMMRGSGGALSDWGKYQFYSVTGRAQTMIASYKDNPKLQQVLRKVFSKIVTNPGARSEVQQFTAQEDIDREMKRKLSLLDRIISTHHLDIGNEEQMKQLFEEYARPTEQVRTQMQEHLGFLKSQLAEIEGDANKTDQAASMRRYITRIEKQMATTPASQRAPENIQKAALDMRKLADQLFYKNRDAGINLGYVSNYMQRVLDREAIADNREQFIEQATLAYQMNNLAKHQKLQREAARLEDLAKAADAATKRKVTVPPKAAAAKKQLAAIRGEMAELTALDPAKQAEDYLYAIEVPDLYVPDRATPKTKYTQQRVLGPAADVVLSDFYMQNPIRALQQSIATTVYRTEYAKRFGNENQELLALRNELLAAGLNPKDLELIDDSIKVAFGQTGNFTSPGDSVANWALSLAQMKLLAKAVFTNIPEPFNTAAVTGRARDGWKALAHSYLPILRGANRKEMNLVMELLGITASSVNETIIANRSGMDFGDKPVLQKLRAGFGYTSLVHPLTNLGNFGSTRTLMDYTHFVAESWSEGTPEQKAEAMAVFNEFGVPPSQRDEFAKFVRSMPKGRPTSTQLLETGDADMKNVYAGVLTRMLRYAIQQPQRVDRSRASFGRVGRFVFSITNFNMSYQRNVLVRRAKIVAGSKNAGAKAAVVFQATYMAAMLIGLGLLAKMAREFWDDPDREEKKKKPEDFKAMLDVLEAADRVGLTGMLSTPINFFTRAKFDREFSALAVGAVPGFYFDSFSKMLHGFGSGERNSPNTNLDERKAWGAFYDLTVGLGSTPAAIGAEMTGPLGWMAVSKLNSRGWKEAFAEKFAPKTPTELASEAAKAEKADMSADESADAAEEAELDREIKQENLQLEYGQ